MIDWTDDELLVHIKEHILLSLCYPSAHPKSFVTADGHYKSHFDTTNVVIASCFFKTVLMMYLYYIINVSQFQFVYKVGVFEKESNLCGWRSVIYKPVTVVFFRTSVLSLYIYRLCNCKLSVSMFSLNALPLLLIIAGLILSQLRLHHISVLVEC